jgi:hypothetical protein
MGEHLMTYRFLIVLLALMVVVPGCGESEQDSEPASAANYTNGNGGEGDGNDGEQSLISRAIGAFDPDDIGGSAERAADIFMDVAMGAEGGAIFYADDVLVHPGEPFEVSAKVQSNRMLPVSEVEISFFLDDELLGTAETGTMGVATLELDGVPEAGDYELVVRITEVSGDTPETFVGLAAPLLVCAREPDARFMIVDLDHTVVDTGFHTVLLGGAQPMPHSQETLRWIMDEFDYELVYLTHRPEHLTVTSKQWLVENDFPRAPLLTSPAMEVISDEYKPHRIEEILEAFPNSDLGIGDKLSDAQAYLDAGLAAFLIPHVDREEARDLREMATDISNLTNTDRLQVVDGWQQIRRALGGEADYPREPYVTGLRDLARQLASQQRD